MHSKLISCSYLIPNLKKETRLHTFLCLVNINTKFAFVRQCNYDAKKNNDPDFKARGANQKVSVGAGVKLMASLLMGMPRVHKKP